MYVVVAALAPSKPAHSPCVWHKTAAGFPVLAPCLELAGGDRSAAGFPAVQRGERILPDEPSNPDQRFHKAAIQLLKVL